VSFPGRATKNHPQQVARRGAIDAVDDRRTPDDLFHRLRERFGFTVDVAASRENAKLRRYYDRTSDGLSQSWRRERVWCNPPFSNIPAWVDKAWTEMISGGCETVVMLLPATRTDQPWWHMKVEPFRGGTHSPRIHFDVEFLPGRIRFGNAITRDGRNRPYFGCCLLVWSRP
jgi:phage N-6-adenine-methyltransferase